MCKNKGHLFIHDKHNNIKIQKGNSEPKKKKRKKGHIKSAPRDM